MDIVLAGENGIYANGYNWIARLRSNHLLGAGEDEQEMEVKKIAGFLLFVSITLTAVGCANHRNLLPAYDRRPESIPPSLEGRIGSVDYLPKIYIMYDIGASEPAFRIVLLTNETKIYTDYGGSVDPCNLSSGLKVKVWHEVQGTESVKGIPKAESIMIMTPSLKEMVLFAASEERTIEVEGDAAVELMKLQTPSAPYKCRSGSFGNPITGKRVNTAYCEIKARAVSIKPHHWRTTDQTGVVELTIAGATANYLIDRGAAFVPSELKNIQCSVFMGGLKILSSQSRECGMTSQGDNEYNTCHLLIRPF